ncbi:MAG: cupin domain-containing protein [Arenicellales bacterium]|nr:cupin domain-containing protein [Pseudomonadales bacterium]MDP7453058.1 cupin domain-containing protein [Arenicellales bacterium]
MCTKCRFATAFFWAILLQTAIADGKDSKTMLPAKISKEEAMGVIFQRDDVTAKTHPDGHKTESVATMSSSDGKFHSGMYRSGKTRIDISKPYGVNEFMYFVSGSVTLTSSDGSAMTINTGEAVTMPKEWTGVWETDGYEKIWVIYSDE